MNLRTLKRLSKRAAALLPALGDDREQFASTSEWPGSLGTLVSARKHWERNRCHASYQPHNDFSSPRGAPIRLTTRAGRNLVLRPPTAPRKGTIMVGGMSGGEEPEWSDETAWEALTGIVYWTFTTWDGEDLVPTRKFRSPSEILRAAEQLARPRRVGGLRHG